MVTLVRAPNPSPMTLSGTNSYLLDCGDGTALVIDPGPAIERHLQALVEHASAQNLRVARIAVSHGHPDHGVGAAPLAAMTGASVYAHPASRVAHDVDLRLDADWRIGNIVLHVMDAPGHAVDHAIFYLAAERALFTGDVILGEGTTVIAPPGGVMTDYLRTLQHLKDEFPDARTIYGGHGPPVLDAQAKIAEYIEHRAMREAQILDALRAGAKTIPEIVYRVYTPDPTPLWPVMARQILAHLTALEQQGRVVRHAVRRALHPHEETMLNPELEKIVGPHEAAVLSEELGTEMRLDALDEYTAV